MPKIGQIEFEKISLDTPIERLGGIVVGLNEQSDAEWTKRDREKAHPNHLRYCELAMLRDKHNAGMDVKREVEAVMESMASDPRIGEIVRTIACWLWFASTYPEVLSVERVMPILKQSIEMNHDPISRLESCSFCAEDAEFDPLTLKRFEDDVLAGLPTVDRIENGAQLERLLGLMAGMRRVGWSTARFESYFENLIAEVKLEEVSVWGVRCLFSFMCVYHESEPKMVIQSIKKMTSVILEKGTLSEGDRNVLLEQTSDYLADFDDFDGAVKFWKESLDYERYPYSDAPSFLICCAVRLNRVSDLDSLKDYQCQLSLNREDANDVKSRRRVVNGIDRSWGFAWFLAIQIGLGTEDQIKCLELTPFMVALNQGYYDSQLDDLIDFCVKYPNLTKLQNEVKRRVEIGLNKINEGRMQDELYAVSLVKAVMRWQKELTYRI